MTTKLLHGHVTDLGGGFRVRRLLPAAQQRSVGPWVFFDHFGPVTVAPTDNHDVRPHPHIGLATVTYLLEGALMHRDSLGSAQLIEPGAINWMCAGRGIVHSERRPGHLVGRAYTNHGLQLWLALPVEEEEAAPAFVHHPAHTLPRVEQGGAMLRVLIGQALGERSPVQTPTPTVFLDLSLDAGATLDLPDLAPSLAAYAVAGGAIVNGQPVPLHQMLVCETGPLRLHAPQGPARLVLLGGDALEGPRHMVWNFVSSRRERIEQAARDWEQGLFAPVPGETDSIPLPALRFSAAPQE